MRNESTHGNGSEVLNLTQDMVNSLIKKTERDIHDFTLELEGMKDELKAAEDMYFPLKNKWDKIQESVAKEKQTLSALIGFRDNKTERKQIRVFRSISNGDKSKRPKEFFFVRETLMILAERRKFTSFDNIIRLIFERQPTWKVFLTRGAGEAQQKSRLIWQLEAAAGLKEPKAKHPKFYVYNDKLGLPEWMDMKVFPAVPKAEFLNSLVNAQ